MVSEIAVKDAAGRPVRAPQRERVDAPTAATASLRPPPSTAARTSGGWALPPPTARTIAWWWRRRSRSGAGERRRSPSCSTRTRARAATLGRFRMSAHDGRRWPVRTEPGPEPSAGDPGDRGQASSRPQRSEGAEGQRSRGSTAGSPPSCSPSRRRCAPPSCGRRSSSRTSRSRWSRRRRSRTRCASCRAATGRTSRARSWSPAVPHFLPQLETRRPARHAPRPRALAHRRRRTRSPRACS